MNPGGPSSPGQQGPDLQTWLGDGEKILEEGRLPQDRKPLLYSLSLGHCVGYVALTAASMGPGEEEMDTNSPSLLRSFGETAHPELGKEARPARNLPRLGVRQALKPPGWRVELLRILKRLVCSNQREGLQVTCSLGILPACPLWLRTTRRSCNMP